MEFFGSLLNPFIALFQTGLDVIYRALEGLGVPNYGAAIILLTVVIKILLYPLTVKQIKSMKAMQELQPKMKRIQEQYKGNPQLMQQEIQKLYESAGVNPFAGCLPMLVQMPILMAVYYALRDMTYAGDPSFFWISSLSEADPLHVLPILSALSTYVVSSQTMSADGGGQMKAMTYTMPAFIGWISWNFASGLVLYWITMNLVQMVQQWWMFRSEQKSGKTSAKDKKESGEDKPAPKADTKEPSGKKNKKAK